MIVKDKIASIVKAHEICNMLLEVVKKECIEFGHEDDPAEQIYLNVHVVGDFMYKMCVLLEGYGQTYGIPTLTHSALKKWIMLILDEHLTTQGKAK